MPLGPPTPRTLFGRDRGKIWISDDFDEPLPWQVFPGFPSGVRLLLDAHALLWETTGDDRLPASVRLLLDDPRSRLVLSVATTWELTLKVLAGRLRLPEPAAAYFDGLIRDAPFEVLAIEQRHVNLLQELPEIRRRSLRPDARGTSAGRRSRSGERRRADPTLSGANHLVDPRSWRGAEARAALRPPTTGDGRTLHVVSAPGVVASREDLELVERLRAGDELAFMMLVEQHQAAMLRIARMYVSSRAVAEDVVQEAWLGVVKGIERFEGRSSLRTWIYRIVANIAKTEGSRGGPRRPVLLARGRRRDRSRGRPVVVPGRERPEPGRWTTFPEDWRGIPEGRLVGNETLRRIGRAIEALPPMQAEVIRLRDILGWSSDEVRNALDLSETNQRVLLHRARTRVRRELDEYLRTGSEDG